MYWKFLILLFFMVLSLSLPLSAQAVVSPYGRLNNKVGIHLAVPDDQALDEAARLVNSLGGDWGYVTVVIQENDRDKGKWQNVFNKMRELHLIPLVRLATMPEGTVWRRPEKEDIGEWVQFLTSLNWVIKNRYIILFNEQNHASEWGGAVNPEHYAEVSYEFARRLKTASPDFFVMLGGFDQSAPNDSPYFLSEVEFIRRMMNWLQEESKTDLFSFIDGWSSHSYPNPGFSGSPHDSGAKTITGYEWELSLLRSFGVVKDLPIFITETGWERNGAVSERSAAENIKTAFEERWLKDDRIVAVTPFVLNYENDPFLYFSWKKPGQEEFYEQFYTIQNMGKVAGEPEQITHFSVNSVLPRKLTADSQFHFLLEIENSGQSVFDEQYQLTLSTESSVSYNFSPLMAVRPGGKEKVQFYIKTPKKGGLYKLAIALTKNKEIVSEPYTWELEVVPNVSLEVSYNLLLNPFNNAKSLQLEIYNAQEQLVYKKSNISGTGGVVTLENIKNIIVGEQYRVVLLKPGYLPRQTFVVADNNNRVVMKPHVPLDWNSDGRLSASDIWWFVPKKS